MSHQSVGFRRAQIKIRGRAWSTRPACTRQLSCHRLPRLTGKAAGNFVFKVHNPLRTCIALRSREVNAGDGQPCDHTWPRDHIPPRTRGRSRVDCPPVSVFVIDSAASTRVLHCVRITSALVPNQQCNGWRKSYEMTTILVILLVLFVFGGGGWGYSRWRG
jgi:hypothetical protein